MKFFLHCAGWFSAARLPLQVAVLTYVGAGGLAGAAVVGGVMLSPVREVVQEAVAPARHFVESVMPMTVPSMSATEPRQAVASQSIGDTRPVRVPSPIAETAPSTIDDSAVRKLWLRPRRRPGRAWFRRFDRARWRSRRSSLLS